MNWIEQSIQQDEPRRAKVWENIEMHRITIKQNLLDLAWAVWGPYWNWWDNFKYPNLVNVNKEPTKESLEWSHYRSAIWEVGRRTDHRYNSVGYPVAFTVECFRVNLRFAESGQASHFEVLGKRSLDLTENSLRALLVDYPKRGPCRYRVDNYI